MRLARTHTPEDRHANGFIAPIIRVSAHLGYSARRAEVATEETWEDDKADIIENLTEAKAHMDAWTGTNAFISDETINAFNGEVGSLEDLIAATDDDAPTYLDNIQNLLHNLAYVGAAIEKDAAGTTAQEGREL